MEYYVKKDPSIKKQGPIQYFGSIAVVREEAGKHVVESGVIKGKLSRVTDRKISAVHYLNDAEYEKYISKLLRDKYKKVEMPVEKREKAEEEKTE